MVSYDEVSPCLGLVSVNLITIYSWLDCVRALENWIEAVSCHVHTSYKTLKNITSDFLDEGDVSVSFWKFNHFSDKSQTFPIRTLPFPDGNRLLFDRLYMYRVT